MKPHLVWDGRGLQFGFKAHKERGIGRYAKNLLNALIPLLEPEQIEILYQTNLSIPNFLSISPIYVNYLNTIFASAWLPIGKQFISQHFLARRPLKNVWRTGKIVHFLSHLDAPFYLGPRTILTVHDLIPQRMKHLYITEKNLFRFQLERWLETRCLYQAAAIISPSYTTKADLLDLYHLPEELIRVIPEAVDPCLTLPANDPMLRIKILDRYGLQLDKVFWLYLGGIDQRKDLGSLLNVLLILKEKKIPGELVIAGNIENDKQYPSLVKKIENLGLKNRVRLLGYVPDIDLPILFNACQAFIYPSLYEGFGLPLLEAMACGAPVVAIKTSAVLEIVDKAGILVEPGDVVSLAQALISLIAIPELAADLRTKGFYQSAQFSWEKTAQQTLNLYQEIADGNFPAR